MKELFRGYYKLTDKEIQNIWNSGFISLDTNVLFNIYRYSEETRKELLRVIQKYSTQLWLTNHSAFEFHKNRITVISEQIQIYEETIKAFKKLENDIVKNLKTPHLSKSVLLKFENTIAETIKDLEKKKDYYKRLLTDDNILSKISALFEKKVGSAFTSSEILEVEKEGEVRYRKKMPPGYKDNDKSENKYGDLIIWKELIRKAGEDKKPFILIIDDLKEDWWLRAHGQTVSPRQELSQELFSETGQSFHLYTPDRFLEFASKTEEVKQEAIDEVREIRKEEAQKFYDDRIFDVIKTNLKLNDFLKINYSNKISENIGRTFSASDFMKKYKLIDKVKGLNLLDNISMRDLINHKEQIAIYLKTMNAAAELQDAIKSIPKFDFNENRNDDINTNDSVS
ncbi:PIN-like domain-containing protein [Niabella sp. CC-SYL272]|uniref:PIN-like domain-containing protein n=1 Tax=Niabella agricola TaxID=2891571 RepID=UPI001F16C3F8|nr:PIN-like domain-containing protein [Niabella agricola]MCF3110915.1 PIN-like domain-containing protein [Niabella agricola]